jgi:hypothetical protein
MLATATMLSSLVILLSLLAIMHDGGSYRQQTDAIIIRDDLFRFARLNFAS